MKWRNLFESRAAAVPPAKTGTDGEPTDGLQVGQWNAEERPRQGIFPGPVGARARLRVALDREAFAMVVAHAKAEMECEVCGVLAGELCSDEAGVFVRVRAAIRGSQTRRSSTHVTFTQDTWNLIHDTLREEYPTLRMVGWYHSHPGHGVVFSEMDAFIHRNFFPGGTQVALVVDPLGGAVAIGVNDGQDMRYVERFWVEGREHAAYVPPAPVAAGESAPAAGVLPAEAMTKLQEIETRLGHVLHELDAHRMSVGRLITAIVIMVGLTLVGLVAYNMYNQFKARNLPPELVGWVPVPVQMGDKTVLLGMQIISWQIPPELNAVQIEVEKLNRKLQEDRLANEAAGQPASSDRESWWQRLFHWSAGPTNAAAPAATNVVIGAPAVPKHSKESQP